MRHRVALFAVVLAGCGAEAEPLPVACRGDTRAYAGALDAAPGVVRLDAQTTLSQCIRRSTKDAEIVTIGAVLTSLGAELEQRAGRGDRRAALQLGYLVGAATRATENAEGLHHEIAQRLERSAGAIEGTSAVISRAVREGIRAGETRG